MVSGGRLLPSPHLSGSLSLVLLASPPGCGPTVLLPAAAGAVLAPLKKDDDDAFPSLGAAVKVGLRLPSPLPCCSC